MATITLYYADIKDAYQAAASAAKKSNSYADELTKKVTKKLANLSGGSTSYTENADYYARTKISQLQERADRYNNYHDQLESFLTETKSIDKAVASAFRGKGTISTSSGIFNYTPGSGSMVLDSLNLLKSGLKRFFASAEVKVKSWIQDAKDWYNTGNHKYYVNIGLGALAIVTGGYAVAAGWAAISGAAAAGGGVAAGVKIIGSCASAILGEIGITNGVAKVFSNTAAAVMSSSDEIAAEEISGLTKASDILRASYEDKENMNYWDYFAQVSAGVFDVTTIVATVVSGFSSLYDATLSKLDAKSYEQYVANCKANGIITKSSEEWNKTWSQYEILKTATATEKSMLNTVISKISSWGGTIQTTLKDGWQTALKDKIKSIFKSKVTLYSVWSSIDGKINSDQSTWDTIKSWVGVEN